VHKTAANFFTCSMEGYYQVIAWAV